MELSIPDDRHAVDKFADHTIGVYILRCEHRLIVVTTLHESPPSRICPSCARGTER